QALASLPEFGGRRAPRAWAGRLDRLPIDKLRCVLGNSQSSPRRRLCAGEPAMARNGMGGELRLRWISRTTGEYRAAQWLWLPATAHPRLLCRRFAPTESARPENRCSAAGALAASPCDWRYVRCGQGRPRRAEPWRRAWVYARR